ncbi:MAG: ParM/StbA family protein [Gammaproteobacteria bacterium]|nr:ParM/StbA family protein [Gammaproteobacteria bacterium]
MIKAGIDLGYNATKVMRDKAKSIFPSIVGTPDQARFSLNGNSDMILTSPDGTICLVGEGAIAQSRFIVRREDREWIFSVEYRQLMLAAFTELATGSVELKIVTGLPVSFYDDKATLQQVFLGEHRVSRSDRDRSQTFTVSECRVIPQPFGALLAASLNDHGRITDQNLAAGAVAIIDVGGKTTNLLSVNRLSEIAKETASVSTGAWDAVRMVREYLVTKCPNLELRDHEIVKAISNRSTKYYGQPVDLTKIVEAALDPMAEQVIAQASQLWGSGARLDAVLVAGGGALLLGPYIKRHFRHARVVDDPVFANVTGYYRFAQRLK